MTILMATCDPGPELRDQLESLAAQTHRDWRLIVGDDSRTDAAQDVLAEFARSHDVQIVRGPRTSAGENFLSLLRGIDSTQRDCIAFCDQDDVWLPDRLARGISSLSEGEAALYCSRTWVCNADLEDQHLSVRHTRPPSFRNALVQNIAAGNTILLNPAGAELAISAARELRVAPRHDWWLYQLFTGCGARVTYDVEPTLLYRQHGGNAEGANITMRAKLSRLGCMLSGDWRCWIDDQSAALTASAHRFTPENRAIFDRFKRMREAGFSTRLKEFARLRLYRQSRAATLALWIGALFRRI
ncbi:glycosyltransferase [Thioclava sp. UBA3469]|uniref:glycosyltransferase n=1 Tax=Thioclava sp. UBA3469 TaxID=1947693 RepID=UPI000C48B1CF|nr:glycosyl transferase family 2 [Thioclava sp.]